MGDVYADSYADSYAESVSESATATATVTAFASLGKVVAQRSNSWVVAVVSSGNDVYADSYGSVPISESVTATATVVAVSPTAESAIATATVTAVSNPLVIPYHRVAGSWRRCELWHRVNGAWIKVG